MVLGYSYSLDCDSESGKNNFVDLEEFPALTKSKPISFSGVTWKNQVFVPTEDSVESVATGNNCLNVSKKRRLKKKKKQVVCSEESADDSSPAKCYDFCFFVSEEVESTNVNQPSFHETHFEFIKSQSKSDAIITNGNSHLTESSIVDVTNPFPVEDEGFVEGLIDCANNHLVSHSFPTNTSNVLSSGSIQHSIQSKPIYESRIISPTCSLNSTKDQMVALGLNHSVSNALKFHTNPIKCPIKEKALRNVRLTNTEQHARSMSPSNLTDIYLSSKDTNDLIDEDDMEGTDLLHLISNSLDRFNAIVHPRDNISTLTSGLGESRNMLSESESCNSYSQDCLFPTDVVTKPATILSADREYKLSNVMNIGNKLVQKHPNHSSLLFLNSEVEQTGKLLETNNSSYTTTKTSCSSFGRLPLSLSYSYSNEVPISSCQPNTTYYSNIPSTIPIDVTAPAVTKYVVPPTDSAQVKNVLTDKSKSCWPTLPVSVTQHNPKVLTSSIESNNLLVELINNNRNMLTDNDIEMLNYLNLDLKNLLCNVSTTNTSNTTAVHTTSVNSPSLHHGSVNNNKCNSMGLFVNQDENLWNHSKSFQSNMSLMHETQLLRHPSQSPQTTNLPPLSSKIFLQHSNTVSSTPVDIMKYECLNNDSDKLPMNSSDKMIFNTKCINNPNNKRNDNFIASFSLTSVNNSTGWSTEAINSLPCDTRDILARSHSVGYHQDTSITTSLSTIGPEVTTTTSCSINSTPIINVSYPFTTGNLSTNRLPIIGHSTSTSGKNKMTFGSLPLPMCTINSTVKNLNGSQQQEGFPTAHCRRQNNNHNIPSNISNISVCSVGTLNSVKQAGPNSQLSGNKSRCCTNSQMASGAVTTITPSDSLLYPGTELVNGKPVVAKWRRACSFYLRGHCKKEDCEFAHDLTKVTCKFWEMGECFKGSTCPFLHGYPPELNIEQQHS
ncbi:unnamed protein product [Schistosoma rodhaini]|uniref:C3H1-type domain-containing protein n=1 Tax=Schistosoma rodhaini TaxID=6188 RepID=A0AA85EMZ4_9TREM|nr:unnamed protein product [Schistosoma rodhaini]